MEIATPQSEFAFVSEFVEKRSGIRLASDKEYLVEARMGPVLAEQGIPDLRTLVSRLRGSPDPQLAARVVEAMTTNETSFFRDVKPFEALVEHVVPDLIERNASQKRLQIWSAACSSGQEPYSIAFALRERFPDLVSWDVRILATDLSTEILSRASEGVYSQLEVNRGLPASHLTRYFSRTGARWQVKEEIRRMIEFREMNLLDRWIGMPELDVVFIRNVLIYFSPELKKDIFARVRGVLKPRGYMFLGGAETTLNLDDGFERLELARAGCFQLKE